MDDPELTIDVLKVLLRNKDTIVKTKCLEYVRLLTACEERCSRLYSDSDIIKDLVELSVEYSNTDVCKLSLEAVVNISSFEKGAAAIFNTIIETEGKSLLIQLINLTLDQKYIFADYTASILVNITTSENLATQVAKTICCKDLPFNLAFQAICNKNFNLKCPSLSKSVCQLFGNLTQSREFQKYLITAEGGLLYASILPMITNGETELQRRGIVSTVFNCLFDSENHATLLKAPFNILPRILYPLAGPEEFDEEEVEKMPIEVQYLESNKEREKNYEVRLLLLQSLLLLCATKDGRVFLRDHQVYPILREYHKWEKDTRLILACENVVDILIRTEEEIGIDNLKGISVPDDMKEKFEKMDADFLKS